MKNKVLAASEVNLSEALKRNRFDAEFFQPHFIKNEKRLKELEHKTILELTGDKVIYGTTPEGGIFEEIGVPFIRSQDLSRKVIDNNNLVFCSEEFSKKNAKSLIAANDILLSAVGATIGQVALVANTITQAQTNQNIARVRIIDREFIPAYVFVFLQSNYGRLEQERYKTGNAQPYLNSFQIKSFVVPKAPLPLQRRIKVIVDTSRELLSESYQKYSEAEKILLKELRFDDYEFSQENTSIRNLVECLNSNRLDAEYWQNGYDLILNVLSNYRRGFSTIGNEFKQLKNNFKKDNNKEYKYIEIGDVDVFTREVSHNLITGSDLPANAKIKFGKRQLITSKVRPNRGATAILDNSEDYIGSSAFTVLVENGNINLGTLMVYLKLKPIRELLLRYNTGTAYPVITDEDVLNLPIPLIDQNVQEKIGRLMNFSEKGQREAKDLFEKSKRAVEIFIEQGQRQALAYLK